MGVVSDPYLQACAPCTALRGLMDGNQYVVYHRAGSFSEPDLFPGPRKASPLPATQSLYLPPADFCAVLSVRSGSRTEKRSVLEHGFLRPVLSPWFQGAAVLQGLRYHGPQHLHIKAGQSVVDTLPSRACALSRFASSPDERSGPEKQHPQSSWKRESGGPFLSLK